MFVGWAALFVSVGQLVVGVLALRSPATPSTTATTAGLAANRRSLNAMLLAAVALLIAATALLKLEASIAAEVAVVSKLEGSANGIALAGVGGASILSRWAASALAAVGLCAAGVSIWQAQRAWRGWAGSTPEPLGVALSALLAMASGVVAIFLLAAMPPSGG